MEARKILVIDFVNGIGQRSPVVASHYLVDDLEIDAGFREDRRAGPNQVSITTHAGVCNSWDADRPPVSQTSHPDTASSP